MVSCRLSRNSQVKATQSAFNLCCDSNMEFHADLTLHWNLSLSTGVQGTAIPIASEAYSILGSPLTHLLIASGVTLITCHITAIPTVSEAYSILGNPLTHLLIASGVTLITCHIRCYPGNPQKCACYSHFLILEGESSIREKPPPGHSFSKGPVRR